MIKIVINEKENYIDKKLDYKNFSVLEAICLLDAGKSILENEFKLDEEAISDLLEIYRKTVEEVEQ